MPCLQIVGTIYETEEGLGGGEDDEDNPDDDPDRLEEPAKENDPAPPPDHDPDNNQDDDEDTVILDKGEEGPEEEGAGEGHVDPVGATGTTPASVSSEVREAITQAYLVSEGKVPPSQNYQHRPPSRFPVPGSSSGSLHCWSPGPQGLEPAGQGTY